MATTKEKTRERVIELIENLKPTMLEKLDVLLDSGAIDFESEDDNYKLPKHIMVAICASMEREFINPYATRKEVKQIKNFNCFI